MTAATSVPLKFHRGNRKLVQLEVVGEAEDKLEVVLLGYGTIGCRLGILNTIPNERHIDIEIASNVGGELGEYMVGVLT